MLWLWSEIRTCQGDTTRSNPNPNPKPHPKINSNTDPNTNPILRYHVFVWGLAGIAVAITGFLMPTTFSFNTNHDLNPNPKLQAVSPKC